ncbi:hypothetical protein RhiXN_06666 [Rhizoctonia solani]|uniref:Glutaminase GtaA n=1 Tax=Rhizoctonia solani TaxID=456999 RepID=A0A8H8P0Y7_9AGAM|nr:uncharacterized protein RhiXN_06666 [Rhizoctonia solani]QRW21677.1 hypothetical protein RhiXN_06666 [Rhizoctonia solani]
MTSFSRALSLAALWLISDSFSPVVQAQNISWQALPFSPPNFPLAVKSPYTSGWIGGYDKELAKQWPEFGTGGARKITLGWICNVRVDNTTYKAMGGRSADNDTVQTQAQFTPTRTIINSRAGPVDLVITFLSALDTNDLVRLSLPFSYLSVSTVSNDGGSHAVSALILYAYQVYADISGEWITSDTGDPAVWSTDANGSILIHQMSLRNPRPYLEARQRAQWGTVYLATNRTSGTTWQTGAETPIRDTFLRSGTLRNTIDTDFRPVNDTWPIMAIAQDLGEVATQAQVVTFTVGHSRDPAVKYFSEAGEQARSLYFRSQFSSEVEAVRYAVSEYDNARTASVEFDNRVQDDAARYSPDYASVVALATRQAFASIEITLNGTGPAADLQDIKLFTKDAAVDNTGSSRDGVLSSVDSLYSIMPMLIYTNPNLGNYALASFFEYPQTRAESYALHDLGLRYSRVLAHERQYRNPVDTTANMIIMTYAFMRYTGDAKLAAKHYYTLKAWADYLVSNALVHSDQLTGDWFMTTGVSNQTNLALKGLIALKSMVEIQDAVGMSNESSTYEDAAKSGLEQWMELSKLGTKFRYESSSEQPQLLHGLYADKILGLNFVPESVYAAQRTQWATGTKSFGVPFNEQYSITSIPWQYFTLAAMITGDTSLLNSAPFAPIKNFTSKAQDNIYGLADVYDSITGIASPGYGLRGNVGGSYALLALGTPNKTITQVPASPSPPPPTATPSSSANSSKASLNRWGAADIYLPLMLILLPCMFSLLLF